MTVSYSGEKKGGNRNVKFRRSGTLTRVHCAIFYQSAMRHELREDFTPSSRVDSSERLNGDYVLL